MRKLRRNYGGATFPILCLGVQHVIATPFPAIPTGLFPWEIWKLSMTNRVEGSIKIYPKWKKGTVANGTQILAFNCWTLVWETSTDE
jgi:hypothetical protein